MRRHVGQIVEVGFALSDGLRVDAEQLCEIRKATGTEFDGLDGGVSSFVFFAERAEECFHGRFNVGGVGCHDESPGSRYVEIQW